MKLSLISLNKSDSDPPLGIAYLAGYIKKYSKIDKPDINIIDREDPIKKCKQVKPDIFGIGAMSTNFLDANILAGKIKQEHNIPGVIGGEHISLVPEELKNSNFDIAVIGEGERTMTELHDLYTEKNEFKKEDLMKVNGIVFKDEKNNLIYTSPRKQIQPIDDIPFPDRDMLKMKEVYLVPRRAASVDNIGVYATLFTSRGCPYTCSFCAPIKFWKTTRLHSPEYVADEVEMLVNKYKVDGIHIFDDLFAVSAIRVKKIADLIQERKINVRFSLQSRTNLADRERLHDLKRMGVTHISYGFETGSEKMLQYLKRNAVSMENHRNAVKLSKEYGFHVGGSFIIGSPTETKEDMLATIKFIKESQLNSFNVYQMVPFPQTEIWDYAVQEGFIKETLYSEDSEMLPSRFQNYNPYLLLSKEIEKEEFKKLFDEFQVMSNQNKENTIKFQLRYLKYLLRPRIYAKLLKNKESLKYLRLKLPHLTTSA